MPSSIYDRDLDKNPANFQPLTPLSFLARAAAVFPNHTAIIHGDAPLDLCRVLCPFAPPRLGTRQTGIGRGDTVTAMLANTPAMLEAHYGVPMTRRRPQYPQHQARCRDHRFILDHAETKVLIIDREFARTMKEALAIAKTRADGGRL